MSLTARSRKEVLYLRPQYQFELLAPDRSHTAKGFQKCRSNRQQHRDSLSAVQRLRGRLYLKDGAIRHTDLDYDGRFHMCGDEHAWHLLVVDEAGEVVGCVRYLLYRNTITFSELRVSDCALAKNPAWTDKVRTAIESELEVARDHNLSYIEIGGWALSEEWRGTRAAMEIALGSYALARLWGGAIGCCTATARHGSASILHRLGGQSLQFNGEDLPAYHDPQYGCSMEILRFDKRNLTDPYLRVVYELTNKLSKASLIVPREPSRGHFNPLPPGLGRRTAMAASPWLPATRL